MMQKQVKKLLTKIENWFKSKVFKITLEPIDNSVWNSNKRIKKIYFFNHLISFDIIEIKLQFIKENEINFYEQKHRTAIKKYIDTLK